MYETLLKALSKPPLYHQSDVSIWQEDHVARQLLNAHLDTGHEGASRNEAFIEKSAQWILEGLCTSDAKAAVSHASLSKTSAIAPALLDLGCGPGLYAERFCRGGCQVTGIDFNHCSISYGEEAAKKKNLPIRYLCQDYLTMNFKEEFDVAVMIYCDYGALTRDDQARLLDKIYNALRPGGKLLLDVFSLAWLDQVQESQSWEHCPCGGFWNEKEYLEIKSCYKYEGNVMSEQYRILTVGGIKEYLLWNTCFTPDQLIVQGKQAGFTSFQFYSDVAGAPYSDRSHTLAVVMEK